MIASDRKSPSSGKRGTDCEARGPLLQGWGVGAVDEDPELRDGLPRGSPTLRAPLTLPRVPAPLSWAAVSQPLWPASMLGLGDRVWALLAAGTFLRSKWDAHPQAICSVAPAAPLRQAPGLLGGLVISTSITAEGAAQREQRRGRASVEASGTNTFCSDSAAWGQRGDGSGVPWGARALVGARGQDASTTPVWCLRGGARTRRDHLGCFLKYAFQPPAPPPGLSPRRWSQVPDLDLGPSPSHSPGPGPESVGPFLWRGGLAFLCLLQGARGRCSIGAGGGGSSRTVVPPPLPRLPAGVPGPAPGLGPSGLGSGVGPAWMCGLGCPAHLPGSRQLPSWVPLWAPAPGTSLWPRVQTGPQHWDALQMRKQRTAGNRAQQEAPSPVTLANVYCS